MDKMELFNALGCREILDNIHQLEKIVAEASALLPFLIYSATEVAAKDTAFGLNCV